MAGILGSLLGGFGQDKREKKNLEGYLAGIGGEASSVMGEDAESVEEAKANLQDQFGMANKLNQQAAGGYQGPGMMATPYAQNEAVVDSSKFLKPNMYELEPMQSDSSKINFTNLDKKNTAFGVLYKNDTGSIRDSMGVNTDISTGKFDRMSQLPVNLGNSRPSPIYDFMHEGRRYIKWGFGKNRANSVAMSNYIRNNSASGIYPEGYNKDNIAKFLNSKTRKVSIPITF